jgi:hypothetical protein
MEFTFKKDWRMGANQSDSVSLIKNHSVKTLQEELEMHKQADIRQNLIIKHEELQTHVQERGLNSI